MFKSYDIPYLEGMNIHKSQLNLDVNRRYLYRNLYLILIRSHMCVLDISFPLNGPKYVVATYIHHCFWGQGLLPILYYSYQRPWILLEFCKRGKRL